MEDKIRIGVCLKAQDNSFWNDVRRGFENTSHEHKNIDVIVKTASRIKNISEQISILKNFIEAKVDVIVLSPSDPIKLVSIIKTINESGIPLIILDSSIDEKMSKKNNLKFYSITFDNYKGGYETGKLFTKTFKKNDKIAVIEGYKTGNYTKRVDGFKDAVKNKLNIVSIETADFEENKAYEKAKKIILKNPDLKAIFATSDNMALGIYTALQELNKNKEIIISGFDLTHAGNIALQQGKLLSSVNVNPGKMGDYALDSIIKIINNKKLKKDFIYDVKLITKENITALPKEALVKRKYKIIESKKDLSEFSYENLKDLKTCPIIIGKNMFLDVPPRLAHLNSDKFIIITDSTVKDLYGEKLKKAMEKSNLNSELVFFNAGETNKTFTTLNNLASKILDLKLSKKSVIVLLGGGVVGNLGGFLSAILMRGIRFVHVPTTVMHQVDASTGGKQAVNTEHGKNTLGTFYEPEFIYNDINVIKTLPEREYLSGIAELIKHALCQSKNLINLAKDKRNYKKILVETLKLKIDIMEVDPREKNEGFMLIYGHTLGHAIEILSKAKLTHGEAISIGMVLASKISYRMGFARKDLIDYHINSFKYFGLPTEIPNYINKKEILQRLFYDKKERQKDLTFCLLEEIGKVKKINNSYAIPVPFDIIEEVIQ